LLQLLGNLPGPKEKTSLTTGGRIGAIGIGNGTTEYAPFIGRRCK